MLKRFFLVLLSLLGVAVLTVALIIVLLQPADEPPSNIEFTRFLKELNANQVPVEESFAAVAGQARFVIGCSDSSHL